jgi:hypothetical protein
VFEGVTTGTPIALLIRNQDQRSKDYGNIAESFRPGHADYGYWKYGIRDYRGGGRSSARETAVRVAAGAIARKWLFERYGIVIRGYMAQLGPVEIPFASWADVPGNAFFAPNQAVVPQLEAYMDELRKSGDSVGARINVVASGVPVGWGEPVFDRLDADIAYAMMSINAVKGVEIGAGFASVAQLGTQHSDEMSPEGRPTGRRRARRHFHRAGRGGEHGHQADLQHASRPPVHQQGRRAGGRQHPRPPRPLRRHPRHADRRSHAGNRPDGPRPAPSRPERRRVHLDPEDRRARPGASRPCRHRAPRIDPGQLFACPGGVK